LEFSCPPASHFSRLRRGPSFESGSLSPSFPVQRGPPRLSSRETDAPSPSPVLQATLFFFFGLSGLLFTPPCLCFFYVSAFSFWYFEEFGRRNEQPSGPCFNTLKNSLFFWRPSLSTLPAARSFILTRSLQWALCTGACACGLEATAPPVLFLIPFARSNRTPDSL